MVGASIDTQGRRLPGNGRVVANTRPGFGNVLGTVLQWVERRRQRTHLAALNDHQLKDIGLNRGDVVNEIDKPFWRG